jgi:hypothetical protein
VPETRGPDWQSAYDRAFLAPVSYKNGAAVRKHPAPGHGGIRSMPSSTVPADLGALLSQAADLTADLGPLAAEVDALAERAAQLEGALRRAAEEANR